MSTPGRETARPWAPAAATAFVGVNVVPMDTERVLVNQTVVVEGGRIAALGPADQVPIPAGAQRIDGRDQYLIPGLTDMHHHSDGPTPEHQILGLATSWHGIGYLTDGVTAIRSLDGAKITKAPEHLRQQALQATDLPVPRWYLSPLLLPSTSRDSLLAHATAAKAASYHHIAIQGLGSSWLWRRSNSRSEDPAGRQAFDVLLGAARSAGLPVSSHSHTLPFDAALALGATGGSIDHLYAFRDSLQFSPRQDSSVSEVPLAKIRTLAAAAQHAGLWVTPTLHCMEKTAWYTPTHVQIMRHLVKGLQDAGVGLLLASDDGWDVHDELAAFVRAGLTPYQALRTGTRNPAEYFDILDSAGTVAVGKRADLVLLRGNPLQDIRHTREPAGVMIGGRWLDRAGIDQRLFANFREHLTYLVPNSSDLYGPYKPYRAKLRALADSLEAGQSPEYERLLHRFAAELGALRATVLAPHRREGLVDWFARLWMREQARRGYRVTVPGVAPVVP